MADTFTPTLNLTKPEINGSPDSWGTKTNVNWDKVDEGIDADRGEIAALKARCAALEAEAGKASWVGEVRMHTGSVASIAGIPGGVWKLCDGQNGTPKLTDAFIYGAGGGTAPGATGGALSQTVWGSTSSWPGARTGGTALVEAQLAPHQHVVGGQTDAHAGHTHTTGGVWSSDTSQGSASINAFAEGTIGIRSHTDLDGAHGHSISGTTDWRGAGQPHDHALPDLSHAHSVTVPTVPPFFALCFVMRIA